MTLFYPDCSNNNWGNENLSAQGQQNLYSFLSQLFNQGFVGVCHKMSQGDGYIDPYGALCQTWCSQNKMPFIGYHWVTEDDPATQASLWQQAGGGANAMFDFEQGPPSSGDMDNFWAVVNAFNDINVNVQLGYIPNWYLSNLAQGGGATDLSGLTSNGILLVSSGYPLGSQVGYASDLYAQCGGDTGEGFNPYFGGPVPAAWQFTSSANVSTGSVVGVDVNAYLGSDINVLFGTASAPVTPPITPPPVITPPTSTTEWTLPDDDSIYAAADVIVAQFLGSGAAAVGTN